MWKVRGGHCTMGRASIPRALGKAQRGKGGQCRLQDLWQPCCWTRMVAWPARAPAASSRGATGGLHQGSASLATMGPTWWPSSYRPCLFHRWRAHGEQLGELGGVGGEHTRQGPVPGHLVPWEGTCSLLQSHDNQTLAAGTPI